MCLSLVSFCSSCESDFVWRDVTNGKDITDTFYVCFLRRCEVLDGISLKQFVAGMFKAGLSLGELHWISS